MLAHRRFNGPAPHKLHINVDRGSMQLSPKRGPRRCARRFSRIRANGCRSTNASQSG
jgi:hypothetical protein